MSVGVRPDFDMFVRGTPLALSWRAEASGSTADHSGWLGWFSKCRSVSCANFGVSTGAGGVGENAPRMLENALGVGSMLIKYEAVPGALKLTRAAFLPADPPEHGDNRV